MGFGCVWIVGLLVVFFVVANILGLSLVFLAYRSVLCFFCVWNEKSYSSKKKKKKLVSFLSENKKPMSYCAQS